MANSATSRPIELALFGQKFKLKHQAESPELANQAVELVVRKVKEAQGRTPKGSAPHHVALIALLDLAAEYLQAKERTEEFKQQVGRNSAALKAWIEEEGAQ